MAFKRRITATCARNNDSHADVACLVLGMARSPALTYPASDNRKSTKDDIMPGITAPDLLVLPRIAAPPPEAADRPVRQVVTAHQQQQGAGFTGRRPFPPPQLT